METVIPKMGFANTEIQNAKEDIKKTKHGARLKRPAKLFDMGQKHEAGFMSGKSNY